MKDADAVIERILYLEGVPNMQRLNPVRVGEDAIEQHKLDLALERDAIKRLNEAIAVCVAKGDNGTRELLERILVGEESGADWLESQLHIVGEIGKERYLAEQIHDVAPPGARFRKLRCGAPSCGGAPRTRALRSGT